jgi:hypothetical protein
MDVGYRLVEAVQDDTIEAVILSPGGRTSVWRKVATGALHFRHEAELVAESGNKRKYLWPAGITRLR